MKSMLGQAKESLPWPSHSADVMMGERIHPGGKALVLHARAGPLRIVGGSSSSWGLFLGPCLHPWASLRGVSAPAAARISGASIFNNSILLATAFSTFSGLLAQRTSRGEGDVLSTSGALCLEKIGCSCAGPDQQKQRELHERVLSTWILCIQRLAALGGRSMGLRHVSPCFRRSLSPMIAGLRCE